MKSTLLTLLLTTRPAFLLLSVGMVLLGSAVAVYQGADLSWYPWVLVLAGAIFAHAAVNQLNEYQDFTSGLDFRTQKTPFSGGSGALIARPQDHRWVLLGFYFSVAMLLLIGGLLYRHAGWGVVLFGLSGFVLILLYTRYLTRMPWLCLIAPGLAFGPIMVLGSYYVWLQSISSLAVAVAMVPFFLVNNLLLLNQVPDLEADRSIGRYNILMALGVRRGLQVFAVFTGLAFLTQVGLIWWFELPLSALLGLASIMVALPMLVVLKSSISDSDKRIPVLTMNVVVALTTPVLMAMGLWLAQ